MSIFGFLILLVYHPDALRHYYIRIRTTLSTLILDLNACLLLWIESGEMEWFWFSVLGGLSKYSWWCGVYQFSCYLLHFIILAYTNIPIGPLSCFVFHTFLLGNLFSYQCHVCFFRWLSLDLKKDLVSSHHMASSLARIPNKQDLFW